MVPRKLVDLIEERVVRVTIPVPEVDLIPLAVLEARPHAEEPRDADAARDPDLVARAGEAM